MPSRRVDASMSPAEVATFLGDGLKAQTATVGRDGSPHLTTLFYVLDGGLITYWTYARSQKVVNLRRDARISVLVEDGTTYDELRGVSITGRGELVEDEAAVSRIGLLVAEAMAHAAGETLGGEARELAEALVAAQAPKRVGVRVRPDRVASWDHGQVR